MSNNLNNRNYYNAIISDMEIYASNEFFGSSKLLSINIDIETLKEDLDENLFQVKTILKKKSKDILFLKTILYEDKLIVAQASALWSKED